MPMKMLRCWCVVKPR